MGTPLQAVVLLNLDLKILFKRLSGRRICENCNQVFNIYTSPPAMLTAKCGDKPHRLIQRDDDLVGMVTPMRPPAPAAAGADAAALVVAAAAGAVELAAGAAFLLELHAAMLVATATLTTEIANRLNFIRSPCIGHAY